ncbi:hypothetical protein A8276_25275 [Salmonella enterica subsp. enterica serovar Typhimurium]|nr:hypothetical protein A8276_25275 [Salmonella enterica subsp. enterica serovar Typhimurium]
MPYYRGEKRAAGQIKRGIKPSAVKKGRIAAKPEKNHLHTGHGDFQRRQRGVAYGGGHTIAAARSSGTEKRDQ